MEEIKIKLENCKNIKSGEITIFKNILNVKYANNGTGKSTIAEAIKYCIENDLAKLNLLKSYGASQDPSISIEPMLTSVEVFNEDFVNNIVFDKNEAIKDSFDVFIRTPEFDKRRKELDYDLKATKVDIGENNEINKMTLIFNDINRKIKFNNDGSITRRGMGKDIINTTNVYNLPSELKKFEPFFRDEERVKWIDWKSNGHAFDEKGNCPFCAEKLNDETYKAEKEVFMKSYSKTMVKNQKDLEDYLKNLKPYINSSEYERIYKYSRKIDNEKDFIAEFKKFCDEVEFVNRKISDVVTFDTHEVSSDYLENLDKKIKGLLIDPDSFKIFNSKAALNIYNLINEKIENLLDKVTILEKEFKEINEHIQTAIRDSENDINSFLETAGINYKFVIDPTSELSSKSELKYCGNSGEMHDVDDIRESLSWGEKNSIALILFMYYALKKEVCLIVLDDPISSFDKNKKFAILHRLFNRVDIEKNLLNKTVLLLTHDLEPIVDLKTKYYFSNGEGIGWFLTNIEGNLSESQINAKQDILPTTLMYRTDFENTELDIVLRLVALRRYLEYVENNCLNENMAYNIISCLIKGRKREKVNIANKTSKLMGDDQFKEGCRIIKSYLKDIDFDYNHLLINEFLPGKIIEKYKSEVSNYHKIQLFRVYFDQIKEVKDKLNKEDPVIKKFSDESFHIENDYSHCLNYREFDIVPYYVIRRVDQYMDKIILEQESKVHQREISQ